MPTSLRPALTCLWLALAVTLLPASAARAEKAGAVTVFAAASLKTALDEVAALWRNETGVEVVVSYAGSSALARQIDSLPRPRLEDRPLLRAPKSKSSAAKLQQILKRRRKSL